MLEFEQMKSELTSYDDTMKEVLTSLDIEGKKNKIQEMEREMEAPDFWNDAEKATVKTTELKSLKDDVAVADSLQQKYEDIETFIEMDAEEDGDDEAMLEEAKEEFEEFKKDLENLRLKTLLSGKYDHNNAIVTLHAGAGGTEAMDWTLEKHRCCERKDIRRDAVTAAFTRLIVLVVVPVERTSSEVHAAYGIAYERKEGGIHSLSVAFSLREAEVFRCSHSLACHIIREDILPTAWQCASMEDDLDVMFHGIKQDIVV